MVYYRTYRPQTIAELDSPQLREKLYAVLSQKNIPHAFLFTGPKGLGKTSTARIIAKVVNCGHIDKGKGESVKGKEKESKKLHPSPFTLHPEIEPDNICDECVSITNGSNIDVLEIDGASNRGIDEIRDLREKVNLAPVAARKKVYIIDEVHMLTTEAFNALLKTIEEPPAHVVFIFCTTEPQKVPATIISRCFHISLTRATQEEIIHALKRITKEEKIDIDDDGLDLIAQMGDGGYRDATKMLEEIVALSNGKKITKEVIEEKTNVSGITYYVSSILEKLKEKDTKAGLGLIEEMAKKGIDIKYFLSQLLAVLHALLLEKVGISGHTTYYILHTTPFSLNEIQELVQLFSQANQDTKFAVIPSLPLELAIVEWCQGQNKEEGIKNEEGVAVAGDPHRVPAGERSEPKPSDGGGNRQDPEGRKNTVRDLAKKEQNLKVQQVLKGSEVPKEPEVPKVSDVVQNNLPQDISDTKHLLDNLIYKVKPYNHSVAGVLRGCSIKGMDAEMITFQTAYKFHKEKLEEKNIRDILEKVIKEITGKSLRVVVELSAGNR